MRGRGSDGLRSTSHEPQARFGAARLAKQGLNKAQRFDPLCLRFEDCVRTGRKIAKVKARKMDDMAATSMETQLPKIVQARPDGAFLSLRLKMGGKGLSNAAAIGKDEPGRRLQAIGISGRDGPLCHPGNVIQQVAGILVRLEVRYPRDKFHAKTKQFAGNTAIFVQQANVCLEEFRLKTPARTNNAVAEQPRTRPRQKSETCDSAGEIDSFPAGPSRIFRQCGREHLHAGIEQRGVNRGAVGFTVGFANRNYRRRKPHFSKRLELSAPQPLDALETRAVF